MSLYHLPKFPVVTKSLHADLKKRVQEYFDQRGINPTGNSGLFTKAILLVSSFLLVYIHLLFFTPVNILAILECVILGGIIAAIGFNVMHDGSHGSFSEKKWMNRIAASSISMLGANHFMWNMKHNMIHHTYTNIDGVDPDIEVAILLRMAPTQKRTWLHQFQHVYFWFLYMLLYIVWLFATDYNKYFSKKIGNIPLKKMSFGDHLEFWLVKIYHAAAFVVLPIYLLGFTKWIIGFLVMTMFAGFVLSIVFQMAHTVEHTHYLLKIPIRCRMNLLPIK